MTYQELIDAATTEATEIRTMTRCDGSTYQGAKGYGSATDGIFQIYVVPVQQRTRAMRDHFRFTFYLQDAAGKFNRVSKAAFLAAREVR